MRYNSAKNMFSTRPYVWKCVSLLSVSLRPRVSDACVFAPTVDAREGKNDGGSNIITLQRSRRDQHITAMSQRYRCMKRRAVQRPARTRYTAAKLEALLIIHSLPEFAR